MANHLVEPVLSTGVEVLGTLTRHIVNLHLWKNKDRWQSDQQTDFCWTVCHIVVKIYPRSSVWQRGWKRGHQARRCSPPHLLVWHHQWSVCGSCTGDPWSLFNMEFQDAFTAPYEVYIYLPMWVILTLLSALTSTPFLYHVPLTFSSDTSHLNTAWSFAFTVRSAMLWYTSSSFSAQARRLGISQKKNPHKATRLRWTGQSL